MHLSLRIVIVGLLVGSCSDVQVERQESAESSGGDALSSQNDGGSGGAGQSETSGGFASDGGSFPGTGPVTEGPYGCTASPDRTGAYTCSNANDVYSGSTCVRESYTCNALNPCEDGYWCTYDKECACTDADKCGISCVSTAECPEPFECDQTGKCRPPIACLSDDVCGCNTGCMPDFASDVSRCLPLGTKTVGSECSSSEQCASGICFTDICLPACETNKDCPSGLSCALLSPQWNHENESLSLSGQDERACIAEDECDADCPADGYCTMWGECKEKACKSTAECEDGDCEFQIFNGSFACLTGGKKCNPDELYEIGNGTAYNYCLQNVPCYTNADCDSEHTCTPFTAFDSLVDQSVGNGSVCARIVGDAW